MNKNIFPFLAIIMILLYLLSFVIEIKNNSVNFIRTAILNPSKADLLTDFELQQNDNFLKFYKLNGIWFCEKNNISYPTDQNQVNKFINNLKKCIKMYKISYNNDDFVLHFNNNSFISLTFLLSDFEKSKTEILFGPCDFSNTKRIIKIMSSDSYFKTEDIFGSFLSADINFWIDPYIIPASFSEKKEAKEISRVVFVTDVLSKAIESSNDYAVSRLKLLRHGKIFTGNLEELKKTGIIKIEYDYGDGLCIHVFDDGNGGFVLNYQNDLFNYSVCISEWTFLNLNKLFD